ncbi:F-box/FBD/LRR-repeat protein At1g13570-like [Solanum dulcamara]|uniref:F-box/FBD/LRR-repeat protein At1g13570-like n=1 Tax=Solanum dulcamara TaxID=45834 RepID=UPI002486573C|nr:F-box/FBD/LRR-repeat protein At1g13570-like [Solanum dulcamara]
MEMTDNSNILGNGGDKLDRLTDLPFNIIHKIQDHVSIEDAARTSVLSGTCRYIWASNQKLVFDRMFCTKRLPSSTIDIISTILFQHYGSIKTFLVDISPIHSSQHPVIDQWMLFLSRNSLMDLTFQNDNSGNGLYKLPSYVYDMGLEHLALSNCIFRPPCSFRGFHKLNQLQFTRVSFELDIATSSLWMPNLERLVFKQCNGLCFLNIHAPKVAEEVSLNRQDKAMKLTDLLSSWPKLSHLVLSRSVLKFFASGTAVESPPMRLTRLRGLYLSEYDFDSEDQRFALLSILRSSLYLMLLQFQMMSQKKKDSMEVDVKYFVF